MKLSNYNLSDTIAAIATFPAPAALGVVKISGRKALPIVSKIFLPRGKKNIKKVPTYTLHYGWIIDSAFRKKRKNQIIDEVLVSIMRKPYSYTREDVVEISSHGGAVVLNKILSLVLKEGARLAQPGEFSYRAFVNGRIDLSQAQTIVDIVEAKTERALFALSRQLKGEFSYYFNQIKGLLKELLYKLEAYLNFPEEDTNINIEEIKIGLKKTKRQLARFLKESRDSRIFREGIRCVLCGKVNVGKSTLFNCLLKEEKAIVTHIPRTTRDAIEETVSIKGLPIVISDTAGILEPEDFIDTAAVEISYRKIREADIVLFVLDASVNFDKQDLTLWGKVKDKNVIFVVNKIDLSQKLNIDKLKTYGKPIVKISALNKTGIKELENTIFKMSYKGKVNIASNRFLLAKWQEDIIRRVLVKIEEASNLIDEGYSCDFILLPLREMLDEMGKLAGENVNEEILSQIFSRFCIGK